MRLLKNSNQQSLVLPRKLKADKTSIPLSEEISQSAGPLLTRGLAKKLKRQSHFSNLQLQIIISSFVFSNRPTYNFLPSLKESPRLNVWASKA
jgi:hypothetical protein